VVYSPNLTIGQVAKTSGVAARTIRYYEQIGVVAGSQTSRVRLPTLRSARCGATRSRGYRFNSSRH
jgi:MerR family regulatory protein